MGVRIMNYATMPRRARLLGQAALAAVAVSLGVAQPAVAQDDGVEPPATTVAPLVVTPEIEFRNRTDEVNPTLTYDSSFFERFEPVSVGEMLKRVPGVTFTSDVLEFDGVSMRGLPPGYTNVTIDGRRAPGGENDGSFFVDRIPAELVERIEIVRSPRADQPSDGMAGTLNIVLKEGARLEGGLVKAGVLLNEDGQARGSAALAYAGGNDDTRWWGALNYQGRRNPKKKQSFRFNGDFAGFDNIELQDDTRDGVDISGNGELTHFFDRGRIRFNGLVVDTNRDEDETSRTFNDLNVTDFDEAEIQAERIGQRTYALGADGRCETMNGLLDLKLGWNRYNEDSSESVWVTDEEDLSDQELDGFTTLDIRDTEWDSGLAYTWENSGFKLKAGLDMLNKTRDFAEVEFEIDDGDIEGPDPEPGAIHSIDERRFDPFVRLTFEPSDTLTLDFGLRFETVRREVTSDLGTVRFSDNSLNPSFHAVWRPNMDDQFRFSAARTLRRPDYDLLAPFFADEEPADEDGLRGNPLLRNEKAWGYDIGYEHRFGEQGVFGVNLFYRDIKDLIELVDTGLEVDEDGGPVGPGDDEFNLFEPRNIGNARTHGIEIDFSSPLDFAGLPNTGLFFNATWLDSDVAGRPFRNQPSFVYNIGFIQTLPAWNASFGASLYDRDKGYEYSIDEDATVDYDGDLEAFIEKRIGEKYVLRLAAINLLDKEKRETFKSYDGDSVEEILDNHNAGNVDESERESERSGVLYQLTLRGRF